MIRVARRKRRERMIESGLPGFEAYLWLGVLAPAGTPGQIVNKLNADIGRILETPPMKEWMLRELGGEFTPNTPDQFSEFLAADVARRRKVIKETGVRFD